MDDGEVGADLTTNEIKNGFLIFMSCKAVVLGVF